MPKKTTIKNRKLREAPDWFGCGRKITAESWGNFTSAYRAYYAAEDAKKQATLRAQG